MLLVTDAVTAQDLTRPPLFEPSLVIEGYSVGQAAAENDQDLSLAGGGIKTGLTVPLPMRIRHDSSLPIALPFISLMASGSSTELAPGTTYDLAGGSMA